MKKSFFLLFVLFFIFCPTVKETFNNNIVYAEEQIDTQSSIETEVDTQLDKIDFSEFEGLFDELSKTQIDIFGGKSFFQKIKDLLAGNFDSGKGMWKAIVICFFENFISLMPMMSLIVAISLVGSMIQGIKPSSSSKSMSNIIHFVTYGIVVVLILTMLANIIRLTSSTIQSLNQQMDVIFPLLLTMMTAIGGNVSVSAYQPALSLLTGVILKLFTFVLLPIFIFSVVFGILSNLSNNIKLEKITSFFQSTYKWMIGLIFTIFTAFISIQGIAAGSIDGISIRTAKYAIKSYVPIMGSYLSDGMGIILASSNLIKNTVGAAGLFLLLATIISPLIEIILFMLALKLISGIIEPLGNRQIANFISSISKSMVLLIALLIGISFVYFITIGLIMCTANVI